MGGFRGLARYLGFDSEVAVAWRNRGELGRAGEYRHGSLLLVYRRERVVETLL